MERRNISKLAVARFAERSTQASARLERREVPAGYVRSEKVEQFLAKKQPRA